MTHLSDCFFEKKTQRIKLQVESKEVHFPPQTVQGAADSMSTYDNRKRAGYSQEDLWFEKENRRLINKMKAKRRREHLKLVGKEAPEGDDEEAFEDDGTEAKGTPEKKAA